MKISGPWELEPKKTYCRGTQCPSGSTSLSHISAFREDPRARAAGVLSPSVPLPLFSSRERLPSAGASLSSPERPTLAPQLSPTTFLHGARAAVAQGRTSDPPCRACILQYSTVESPRPGRKSTMCHTEFRILPIDRNDSEPTPAREANDGGDAGSRRRHSSAPGLGRFEMDEDAFQVVCGGAFAVAQQACKRSLSTSPHRARLQPRSA